MIIKLLVPGKSIGKKRPHVTNKITNDKTPNNTKVHKKKRKKSCKDISVRRYYFNNDQ